MSAKRTGILTLTRRDMCALSCHIGTGASRWRTLSSQRSAKRRDTANVAMSESRPAGRRNLSPAARRWVRVNKRAESRRGGRGFPPEGLCRDIPSESLLPAFAKGRLKGGVPSVGRHYSVFLFGGAISARRNRSRAIEWEQTDLKKAIPVHKLPWLRLPRT